MAQDRSIGRLFISIHVDEKDYKKGLAALNKSIQTIAKGTMVAGGAVVAGMTMAAKSYAEAAHQVEILSAKTGLSFEATQRYGHAAEVTGSSIEGLGTAIKMMDKVIAGAEAGTKASVKTLGQLGLTIDDIKNKNPDEQFETIALAIAAIPDPAMRSTAAVQMFGRAGTDILPMLAEGADGLKKLTDAAVVMSDEQVRAGAVLQDSIEHMQASFKGLVNTVGGSVGPTFQGYISILDGATGKANDLAKSQPQLSSALSNTALSAGEVLLGLTSLTILYPKLNKFVTGLASTMKLGMGSFLGYAAGIVVGLTMIATGVNMLISNHEKFLSQKEAYEKMAKEAAKANAGLANEFNESATAYADAFEIYVKASGLNKKQKEERFEIIKGLREEVARRREAAAATEEQSEANQELNDKLNGYIEKSKYANTAAGMLGVTIEDITAYMVSLGRETELFGLNWDFVGEDANRAAKALGISLEDVYSKTNSVKIATEELNTILQEQYDAIDKATSAALGANNEKINAIDAEIEASRQAEKEKNNRDRIDEIKNQIANASGKERARLKKELAELEEDIAREKWENEKNAERDALLQENKDIQQNAQTQKDYLAEQTQAAIEQLSNRQVQIQEYNAVYNTLYLQDLANFMAASDAKVAKAQENAAKLAQIEANLVLPPNSQQWSSGNKNFGDKAWDIIFPWHLLSFDEGGIVPGPVGKQTLVQAVGGEKMIPPGSSGGRNITIQINHPVIREEQDIRKISQEISREFYRVQQMRV